MQYSFELSHTERRTTDQRILLQNVDDMHNDGQAIFKRLLLRCSENSSVIDDVFFFWVC